MPKKLRRKIKPISHDALFKKIMQEDVAAREFLEYYLPCDFKELVDLSQITVEKESFIEDGLKRKFSDLIYSIKTKRNETAFVYVLIEHQSEPDHWIALRLWKYMLLLCERHKKDAEKLPLIAPLVFYNGKKEYNSAKNLWELFSDPKHAQKLMTKDYQLIDLHSMLDDEIIKKQHLGMMEFFMKHIHQRDMLKLWKQFLESFEEVILIDKKNGYIYIKQFLWYTDTKVSEEDQHELSKILIEHLTEKEEGDTMRTIAQKYYDEGIEEGIEKGREEGVEKTVINMLREKFDIKLIAQITGFTIDRITSLKAKLL